MKSAEYWQNRLFDTIVSSELSVVNYEESLAQAYEYALVTIKKEVAAFFQKYAKDNKVAYAEARRRLDSKERKDFNTLLKEWYAVAQETGLSQEFSKYLKELAQQVYITRMESLEASIRYELEKLKINQHTWMTDLMSDNYMVAYYDVYYTLAQGAEVAVRFATIDSAGVEKAIKTRWDEHNYSSKIWDDRNALVKTLETVIPQSFSRGMNSSQLGDMISVAMNTSKNRGRALARTEVNFIANQAQLDVYRAAKIEEYDYLATLDLRTSEICRSLDGKTFKVSQAQVGVNYPPMHTNCRSTTVAHFEGLNIEDRVAKDEDGNTIRVPRKMTQEEWIKQYAPKELQEKLLAFKKKYPPEE
jgi:SPP1 gp7 family putative phage head morphogenesis protein